MSKISWDKEIDTVVVGFGYAGAVAAIQSHDSGAKTLVLEKEGHPAGCSSASGGAMMICTDVKKMFGYLKYSAGGIVSDELLHVFCEELYKNPSYLDELCKPYNATVVAMRGKYANGIFDHPGREAMGVIRVIRLPGFDRAPDWYPGVLTGKGSDGQASGAGLRPGIILTRLLMNHVERRKIQVMWHTFAKELVRNPETNEIEGLKAESNGKEVYIKAKKAVILASGGFEQNPEMIKKFCQGSKYVTFCHP
ncbi:MAG: FAD-dependent oxidoreductase, partial [Desulfobacterales bacterium]|nr:FAD-dependent oxidoreductase [Desulfobacterales bacterium]